MSRNNSTFDQIIIQIYLFLFSATGCFTLVSILNIQSETGIVGLFGLSPERFLLSLGVIILILSSVILLTKSLFRREWFVQFSSNLIKIVTTDKVFLGSLFLCAFILVSTVNILLSLSQVIEPVTSAYYIRIRPLLIWVITLCIQTLASLYIIKFGLNVNHLKKNKNILSTIAIVALLISATWLWVGFTGYGLSSIDYGVGWHALGTPIIETQVILVWSLTITFLGFYFVQPKGNFKSLNSLKINKDLVICILLWLIAFISRNIKRRETKIPEN